MKCKIEIIMKNLEVLNPLNRVVPHKQDPRFVPITHGTTPGNVHEIMIV